jgi:Flp pilus assembly pilin Flp
MADDLPSFNAFTCAREFGKQRRTARRSTTVGNESHAAIEFVGSWISAHMAAWVVLDPLGPRAGHGITDRVIRSLTQSERRVDGVRAFLNPDPANSKENHMPQVFVSIQNRLTIMRDQQGQTMAEYGVVLAVITLVVVGGLMLLAGGINGALEEVTGIF